jgi:hypothetical protein
MAPRTLPALLGPLLAATLLSQPSSSLPATSSKHLPGAAPQRRALFWLEPYANVTSVAGYQSMWAQFAANARPGYIVAGSAYALKHNGSLGLADTAAGEGLYGALMETYGFPALRAMNLTALAMTYFTHEDGIAIVLKNPAPFVKALVSRVLSVGLAGVDLDYEPQGVERAKERLRREAEQEGKAPSSADPFFAFLSLLGTSLASHNLLLTLDATGGCGSIDCPSYASTPGLLQVNTMDTFNVQSLSDFQGCAASDLPGLGGRWAAGFEPGNVGESVYTSILAWAAGKGNVTAIATWEVHEFNVGPQPQWLFDAVNSFLEAPSA